MTDHQTHQVEVIDAIAAKVAANAVDFSTVAPVDDFATDPRRCLTGVHFPAVELKTKLEQEIIAPLRQLQPELYYFDDSMLHCTVKSVFTIADPPNFTEPQVQVVADVFARVLARHKRFRIYFYHLLLFPSSLALIGTSDPEFDEIILDLHQELGQAGVPDDKRYLNDRYFFANITLARFANPPSAEFVAKVVELSNELKFDPYVVDSVSLMTGTATMEHKREIGTWQLP